MSISEGNDHTEPYDLTPERADRHQCSHPLAAEPCVRGALMRNLCAVANTRSSLPRVYAHVPRERAAGFISCFRSAQGRGLLSLFIACSEPNASINSNMVVRDH